MSEETPQPETVEDPMKRIAALREQIKLGWEKYYQLERAAGDAVGNSQDPAPINERIAQQRRFIRDLYAEIEKVQAEINQQAEIQRVETELSQDEQGDETNESA